MQAATVSFVGYMGEDRLDKPFYPIGRHYLSVAEFWRFAQHEPRDSQAFYPEVLKHYGTSPQTKTPRISRRDENKGKQKVIPKRRRTGRNGTSTKGTRG